MFAFTLVLVYYYYGGCGVGVGHSGRADWDGEPPKGNWGSSLTCWKWKSLSRVQAFATPWAIQSVMSDSLQPHGLHSPGNSPGQNTGMGSFSLLQGFFPAQGLNPGLPHCRRILYLLSHQRSPRILEWVAWPFTSGSSRPRSGTRVSCIASLVDSTPSHTPSPAGLEWEGGACSAALWREGWGTSYKIRLPEVSVLDCVAKPLHGRAWPLDSQAVPWWPLEGGQKRHSGGPPYRSSIAPASPDSPILMGGQERGVSVCKQQLRPAGILPSSSPPSPKALPLLAGGEIWPRVLWQQ